MENTGNLKMKFEWVPCLLYAYKKNRQQTVHLQGFNTWLCSIFLKKENKTSFPRFHSKQKQASFNLPPRPRRRLKVIWIALDYLNRAQCTNLPPEAKGLFVLLLTVTPCSSVGNARGTGPILYYWGKRPWFNIVRCSCKVLQKSGPYLNWNDHFRSSFISKVSKIV